MSKALKFFLVLLAIFALSVLLAPPFYSLLSSFFKFEKIFNRLVMIFSVSAAVLFILIPAYKKEKKFLRPGIWSQYGFDFLSPWRKLFFYGFLAGGLTVALMAVVEVAIGPRYLRQPLMAQDIVERFFKGMLSGLIIGIVEEFFFRGFIFMQLKKRLNLWVAVIAASAFYSLTHFLDNGQIFIPAHPSMKDAVRLLLGYLEPMMKRPSDILPEFTGLFFFGVLLNIAFMRTQSLFLPIGIHAGAVFLIKFQHSFVRGGPETYHSYFGTLPYYDGVFEWFVLVLLGVSIWFMTRKPIR